MLSTTHTEFISVPNQVRDIIKPAQLQEILKQVQDDDYRTDFFTLPSVPAIHGET